MCEKNYNGAAARKKMFRNVYSLRHNTRTWQTSHHGKRPRLSCVASRRTAKNAERQNPKVGTRDGSSRIALRLWEQNLTSVIRLKHWCSLSNKYNAVACVLSGDWLHTAHIVQCRWRTAERKWQQSRWYTWSIITCHSIFVHNFEFCWPIFKILSLLDSAEFATRLHISNRTLNVSLY